MRFAVVEERCAVYFHAARRPLAGFRSTQRGGHRTVQRVDEHGPEPAPEEVRALRETIQGMKSDSPSVHRRPKQPCKV